MNKYLTFLYHLKEAVDIMIYHPLILQHISLEKKENHIDQIMKVFCCPSDVKANPS